MKNTEGQTHLISALTGSGEALYLWQRCPVDKPGSAESSVFVWIDHFTRLRAP